MRIEVIHTDHAENYLKDVFDGYVEVDEFPTELNGRTIIHIYPKEDTFDTDGSLTGFQDAYNCEIHIYNVESKTVYKTKRLHDQIELDVPCRIRSFKDLSTMIIIDAPIKLYNFQSLEVRGALWNFK